MAQPHILLVALLSSITPLLNRCHYKAAFLPRGEWDTFCCPTARNVKEVDAEEQNDLKHNEYCSSEVAGCPEESIELG